MLSLIADFVHLGLLLFQNKLSWNFKTWWQWLNKENSEIKPSGEIRFEKIRIWPHWKHNFLRFRLAKKLHEEKGAVHVSALIYTMGREAQHVLKSFTLAEGDDSKIGVILAKDGQLMV